jgi:hypothetical protein
MARRDSERLSGGLRLKLERPLINESERIRLFIVEEFPR